MKPEARAPPRTSASLEVIVLGPNSPASHAGLAVGAVRSLNEMRNGEGGSSRRESRGTLSRREEVGWGRAYEGRRGDEAHHEG
jgi:hypothetical protein